LNYELAVKDALCQYRIKNSNKYIGFIIRIHGEVYVRNIINSILSYLDRSSIFVRIFFLFYKKKSIQA
jgi:hypothetical protein